MKRLAFDTETTGLHAWLGDRPFCFSLCWEDGRTVCEEFPVDPFTRQPLFQKRPRAFARVKRLLENPRTEKIGHHIKFDIRMCHFAGIEVAGPIHDTMLMAHCCNSTEPSFALKPLAIKYLDFPDDDQKELQKAVLSARRIGKKLGWKLGVEYRVDAYGNPKPTAATNADYWMPVTVGQYANWKVLDGWKQLNRKYAIGDAERTMALFLGFESLLDNIKGAREAYETEMRLLPVVMRMEDQGVSIHLNRLDGIAHDQQRTMKQTEDKLKETAGFARIKNFNINSDEHIRKLCAHLRVPLVERTAKTNKLRVNADNLAPHIGIAAIKNLFDFRSASKTAGYLMGYRRFAVDGKIHANFKQTGARTRRFSSASPNLQNTASKDTGKSISPIDTREPFGPQEGRAWYLYDASQLEVRFFADITEDETMIDIINAGGDFHAECARKAWGGDTPAATKAAMRTLQLDNVPDNPDESSLRVWKHLGLIKRLSWFERVKRLPFSYRQDAALKWLTHWKYDIVAAEKAYGKEMMRYRAKQVFFALIFGGWANAVMGLLFCSYNEAEQLLEEYNEGFPGIKRSMQRYIAMVKRDGGVLNRYGCWITVPYDLAYKGMNYVVQGSAASWIKHAMLKTAAYLVEIGIDAHLILSIHDELGFDIKRSHAGIGVLCKLRDLMEDHGGALRRVETPVKCSRVLRGWNDPRELELPKR